MIPHFYQSIEGWFDFDDIYSEQVARAKDGAKFVEIGVYKGKSAAYMAVEIANSGKAIGFFGVDKFNWPQDCYEQCFRNLIGGGVKGHIGLVIGDSISAAHSLSGEFNFIFIDASHEYEDVKSDIAAWFPKLAKGGVVGGHDYSANAWGTFPGVYKAVHEFFDPKGLRVEVRRSSWLVRT